jgi:flagellar hook assembly protein FlgD
VRITIYNAYGKVLQAMDGNTAKGENQVFWDGRSDYNDSYMGQKILIWQLEIYFRGAADKVIKQFTMNAR